MITPIPHVVESDGALSLMPGQGGAEFVASDERRLTRAQGFQLHGISVPCAKLIGAWWGTHYVMVNWYELFENPNQSMM